MKFNTIAVPIINGSDDDFEKKFQGRWLIDRTEEMRTTESSDGDAGTRYAVALTKDGMIAVNIFHCNDAWSHLNMYNTFEEAMNAGVPHDVVTEAANRAGEESME